MHCTKCNYDNTKGSKFCIKCGSKIEKESIKVESKDDSKNQRQNKIKSIINKNRRTVIVGIVFIALISGFISINNSVNKKIDAFDLKISKYQELFRQYILEDSTEEYSGLMSESEEIIKNKDFRKIDGFLKTISEFEQETAIKNRTMIEHELKKLDDKDISRAYSEELSKINELKSYISEDIRKKRYRNAITKIEELEAIIEDVSIVNNNLSIKIDQIDVSEYPKVKLYLNIKDKSTDKVPKNLGKRFFYLSEKLQTSNKDYIRKEITKVAQLNENEKLNIDMVADISGSMEGYPLDRAKEVMNNFLENVQFEIGDAVELIAFSDGVYPIADFTSDKKYISNEIQYLNAYDKTSLYDALFAAINRTAIQNGAKCIIAFTDGADNNSQCTEQEVLDLANRYGIPIFIIGIGDNIDTRPLKTIASNSNGFYSNVTDIYDISEIYNKIYRQQKELYVVEYEITEPENTFDLRNIKIDLQTREIGGICELDYKPKLLLSVDNELSVLSDVDSVISKYLNCFVEAMNNDDFSYIENLIVKDGPLYKEVKPYIQKNIKENLISYEIVDTNYTDDNTCVIKVHETYEIQNQKDPLHMRVLEAEYVLKKQDQSDWKIHAFNSKIKILSKIRS